MLSVSRVSNNSVKIFPNPSNGELYFSGIAGNSKITIYSIAGKKILTTVASNNESIQLDVKAGFYLAKIENVEQQVTKKLIIK